MSEKFSSRTKNTKPTKKQTLQAYICLPYKKNCQFNLLMNLLNSNHFNKWAKIEKSDNKMFIYFIMNYDKSQTD